MDSAAVILLMRRSFYNTINCRRSRICTSSTSTTPKARCSMITRRRQQSTSTTNNSTNPTNHDIEVARIASAARQKAAYDYYLKQAGGRKKYTKRLKNDVYSDEQKNVNTAWYALAIAVGALGATYAAVPLYKVFCQTTGFGGTTQRVLEDETNTSTIVISNMIKQAASAVLPASTAARVHTWTDEDAVEKLANLKPVQNAELITIRFDTTVSDILPWSFVPVQLDVKVVPGETALSFFRVTNHSDKAITGVATYNVHPPKVGLYFQKIQCFCFEEQRLLPGETVDMPVFFFIDPEILNDSQVSYIRSVTLSYTFFQTDEDYDVDDDDEEKEADDDDSKDDKKNTK